MMAGSCSVRGCRRIPRQAFDVYNPWPDGKPKDRRHYEVCDEHAAEFWPGMDMERTGGRYIEREQAERIRNRLVAR